MRKIMQIATSVLPWTGEGEHGERVEHFEETLYALADDGTLWYSKGSSPTLRKGWAQCVALPDCARLEGQ